MINSSKNIVFSGIQPTGVLHLGNYLGAIKNWQNMIKSSSSNDLFIFSIVDLHAITIFQNQNDLQDAILKTFATYIACGLCGSNVKLFVQSSVPFHTELAWLLSCFCPIGWLDRMTQYKEKTTDNKERANLGLYTYPVLMAADILLYKTTFVPVGEDQVQHIELARDIASRVNHLYKQDVFTLPQHRLTESKRIMSLKDASKKMSKSDSSDFSRINLLDSDDLIVQKVKKATTGNFDSPEVLNLSLIYKTITGSEPSLLSFSSFKSDLSDAIIAEISPIREKTIELLSDKNDLLKLLCRDIPFLMDVSSANISSFKKIIGII